MLKLIVSEAQITCSAEPVKISTEHGKVVAWAARVDFMGGSFKGLANPNRYDGPAKEVEILVTNDNTIQKYGANEVRGAGEFVRPDIRLGAIVGAKAASKIEKSAAK